MKNMILIAMAFVAVGLSACSSTDTARVDQAPYSDDRTVGASTTKAPVVKHTDTVFHSKQSK